MRLFWRFSNIVYQKWICCRFRQGFLSVFHFFLRIPRNPANGDNLALNQMNSQNHQHQQRLGGNNGVNGNGKVPGKANLTQPTTVRLNGSTVSTSLQPTTPKSNCTLSVSVNVEKMNQSQCSVSQELWQFPASAERLI